jgi:hypothetical protein
MRQTAFKKSAMPDPLLDSVRDILEVSAATVDLFVLPTIAFRILYWGPRIIAANGQAPRIYPRMILLCSRFDSVLFTPKRSAIATCGNYSRSPIVLSSYGMNDDFWCHLA